MKNISLSIKFFVVIVVAMSMSSCASMLRDKVSIEGYDNLQVLGFSGVKADIKLRNESIHKLKVKGVVATIKDDRRDIATLELKDGFVLPRRTESIMIPTVWRLRDVDMLVALAASKQILSGQGLDSFKVDLSVEGKVSLFKKRYVKRDVPLSDLIKRIN